MKRKRANHQRITMHDAMREIRLANQRITDLAGQVKFLLDAQSKATGLRSDQIEKLERSTREIFREAERLLDELSGASGLLFLVSGPAEFSPEKLAEFYPAGKLIPFVFPIMTRKGMIGIGMANCLPILDGLREHAAKPNEYQMRQIMEAEACCLICEIERNLGRDVFMLGDRTQPWQSRF
jgi:hypothetical protein